MQFGTIVFSLEQNEGSFTVFVSLKVWGMQGLACMVFSQENNFESTEQIREGIMKTQ